MTITRVLICPLVRLVVTVLAAAGLTHSVAAAEVLRLSEPVAQTATHETFGEPMASDTAALRLGALLADPAQYQSSPVAVEAKVGKVCQKKGCFFVAQDGPHAVRVSFKDYGFFVPTDIAGRTVTLIGQLTRREMSSDQARHLNADANLAPGDEMFKPGQVYELVASAVRVPKQ